MANKNLIRFKHTLLASAVLMFVTSCQQSNTNITKEELKKDAAKLATLECESREITHQKFILAQKYQMLETHGNKRLVSNQPGFNKSELDKQKAVLIKQSLDKSDTLNHILKALWQTKYKTNEDKKNLDEATEIDLKKNCSLATP